MNNQNEQNYSAQSVLKINDFNQPEQQFIENLSQNCKMEISDVIDKLMSNEGLSENTHPTLLENGSIKILNLSPEFYKLKEIPNLRFLPQLKKFYLSEDYRKTRMNRIKKIDLTTCQNLEVISICAGKLTELKINSPKLETLILRAPILKNFEFNDLSQIRNIEFDSIAEFDISQLKINWSLIESLSIKRMAQDIPVKELINIQRLTLDFLKDVNIDQFYEKKISLEARSLEYLDLTNTNIKEIYLDKCINLKSLILTEKKLVNASFNFENIEKLDINANFPFLGSDHLNKCKQLKELRIVDYRGLTLKLQLEQLQKIYLLDPEIITLDVTLCPKLYDLSVTGRLANVDKLKMRCEDMELFINYATIKTLDISTSQDSAYLKYTVNAMNIDSLKLICRDTQLERHKWLKKDFSNIKIITSNNIELDKMLDSYNFDEGNKFLEWIINHPNCDKGTALKMYWRLGSAWHSQYESKTEIPSHAREDYDLIKKIEKLYLAGYFKKCNVAYEPETDFITPYEDVMIKERIPDVMFLSTKVEGIKSILKGLLKK